MPPEMAPPVYNQPPPPEYEVGPDYGAPYTGLFPVPQPSLPVQNLPAVSWEDRQVQIVQELTQKAMQPEVQVPIPGLGTPIVGQTDIWTPIAGVNAGMRAYISGTAPGGRVALTGIDAYWFNTYTMDEIRRVS